MKKQLLALSMIAASSLSAETATSMQNQTINQSNTCSTCCCNPCCCRNPRPCVDCECYVPQFYNLECDWGFFLDVEFLYWYAREDNIPYAARVQSIPNGNELDSQGGNVIAPIALLDFDAEWDPGVRAGLGWNSACDGWDLYLNWTYYRNTSRKNSTTPEFEGSNPAVQLGDIAFLCNFFPYLNSNVPYAIDVTARWVNRFNQIDFVLGRKYWLSRCFVMRPYIGLRGAWTRTRISLTGSDGEKGANERVEGVQSIIRDRNWGVGFVGGIDPTFYFTNCFALYGNIGLSTIWGNFDEQRSDSLLLTAITGTARDFAHSFSYNFDVMSLIVDMGIGLRWESTWCCDRYRTAFDIGWEHHKWLSNAYHIDLQSIVRFGTTIQESNHYTYNVSDLGYGGLVVRLKWDF